ncbi:MAG TPA: amidohydrolase family protein [Ohtaekwangia sp.]
MIDSHQHFWKFNPVRDSWITEEMSVIRRDFYPQDLKPVLDQNKIEGCVAVQADQSEDETHFLVSLADQNDFIKGVVGWVDLRSNDLPGRLEYFSGFKKLKGFRHIVQGEPAGFLTDKKFIEGIKALSSFGFTYDLLIYHYQLEEALQFVHQLPEVKIVVDHLAKPSIRTGEKTHWELNMAALATFKNVHCKISGMVTEADWKKWNIDDFFPYLDELFEAFGAERLMYGSDWPVCLVAASYEQQLGIVQQYLSDLSDHEKQLVMSENARKFYNL